MSKQEFPANQVYSIRINNQIYRFACTDGEAHVRELEKKINETVDTLRHYDDKGHKLTDYAMKMVLLIADNAVRASYTTKPDLLDERFAPLLAELDRVIAEE